MQTDFSFLIYKNIAPAAIINNILYHYRLQNCMSLTICSSRRALPPIYATTRMTPAGQVVASDLQHNIIGRLQTIYLHLCSLYYPVESARAGPQTAVADDGDQFLFFSFDIKLFRVPETDSRLIIHFDRSLPIARSCTQIIHNT